MFDFLIICYPLYQTSRAIQSPTKTKKAVFEHWTIFWFLYVCLELISYPAIEIFVWLFYLPEIFLTLFHLTILTILVFAYFPSGSQVLRRYMILPAIRDLKSWIRKLQRYRHLYNFLIPNPTYINDSGADSELNTLLPQTTNNFIQQQWIYKIWNSYRSLSIL